MSWWRMKVSRVCPRSVIKVIAFTMWTLRDTTIKGQTDRETLERTNSPRWSQPFLRLEGRRLKWTLDDRVDKSSISLTCRVIMISTTMWHGLMLFGSNSQSLSVYFSVAAGSHPLSSPVMVYNVEHDDGGEFMVAWLDFTDGDIGVTPAWYRLYTACHEKIAKTGRI